VQPGTLQTTTGGAKKAPRYRWNYEVHRTPDSDSDFTDVFSLVDAANSSGTPNYVANMEKSGRHGKLECACSQRARGPAIGISLARWMARIFTATSAPKAPNIRC